MVNWCDVGAVRSNCVVWRLCAMTQYALSGRTLGFYDPKGYWVMADA